MSGSSPSPATSSSAAPVNPGSLSDMVNGLDQIQAQRQRAQGPVIRGMQKDYATDKARADAQLNQAPVKLPSQPQQPVPNPVEGFASVATAFALLASAFTHTPAIAAMNGIASAINARNANDLNGYKLAMQSWKDNTNLAVKREQMHQARVSQALDLMRTDVTAGSAMLKTVDSEFGDQQALLLDEAGLWTQREQLSISRANLSLNMKKTAAEVDATRVKTELEIQQMHMLSGDGGEPGSSPASSPGSHSAGGVAAPPESASKGAPGASTSAPANAKSVPAQHELPPGVAGLSGAAIDQMARNYLMYNTIPSMGSGPAGQVQKNAILNWASHLQNTAQFGNEAQNSIETTAKQIASYQIPQLQGYVLQKPWGEQVVAEVARLNPSYNAERYNAINKSMSAFGAGGKEGDQIRFIQNASGHLETLHDLATALQNNNVPLINRLFQKIGIETGAAAPTNFETAKQLVANEIVRSVTNAGSGGEGDREEAAAQLRRAASPSQIYGAIDVYRRLLRTQIGNFRQQYDSNITNYLPKGSANFDSLINQQTSNFLDPGRSLPSTARAALKEGHITTFANGQKWTLHSGEPEQVQ